MQKFSRAYAVSLVCLLAFSSFSNAAVPRRGSSQNGIDVNGPFWALFGPTQTELRLNKAVTLATQVLCTNSQVASAVNALNQLNDPNTEVTDSGSCKDGAYTFLFQINTNRANLTVNITGLVGFTPVDSGLSSTYGVALCDTPDNTLQLCTHTTDDQLAHITATINKKKTRVTFFIPTFPIVTAGTGHQGQGLTLVVLTQQATPLPIIRPTISFKAD